MPPARSARPLKEGDALRRLSEFLWCPGRTAECRAARPAKRSRCSRRLPPGRELAHGVREPRRRSAPRAARTRRRSWAVRALELAERLDDTEVAVSTPGHDRRV